MRKLFPFVFLVLCLFLVSCGANTSVSSSTAQPARTSRPPIAPVATLPIPYPPKTLADLHVLAARGNASAVHEFHRDNAGIVTCPQPTREVTVAGNLTGQQLAEDLLAYFFAQHLDSSCGSLVGAYHAQSEVGNGYTAGRILLDVADASGQANIDPNATGLKYTLTLDTGDIATGQESVVSWTR